MARGGGARAWLFLKRNREYGHAFEARPDEAPADALLGRETLAGLAANDNGMNSRRLEVKLGYGLGAFGDRFTMTPEFGLGLSDSGRDYRAGSRRGGAGSFELGLEATRKEPVNANAPGGAKPEHGVGFELKARF